MAKFRLYETKENHGNIPKWNYVLEAHNREPVKDASLVNLGIISKNKGIEINFDYDKIETNLNSLIIEEFKRGYNYNGKFGKSQECRP